MGFARHFLPEYAFAYTLCYGRIDDNSLRVHILSFNIEAKEMQNIRELADARELENASRVTVQGLVQLSALGQQRAAGKGGLLAILVADPLTHQLAGVYANLLKDFKKKANVFYDAGEALAWLGYDDQAIQVLKRFMQKHRV